MADLTTHTLAVPGATLAYDIRASTRSTTTPLLLIGSPMGAAGFVTLAGHFADRTVITYDPRGAERSTRIDPTAESTPDEHADDLRRLLATLALGPVDLFASSGGAVNALALVAKHPEQVRTLVAHEPPATSALPDAEIALAVCREIRATYLRSGFGPAMARFIGLVSHAGPLPADYLDRPAPDPAMFGLPTVDDGTRSDPLLGQNMVTCNAYAHDYAALRSASTRIVLGISRDGPTTLAGRAATAVAERLGQSTVSFPGGHDGFLGGEYGISGEPDGFAATLREVLDVGR